MGCGFPNDTAAALRSAPLSQAGIVAWISGQDRSARYQPPAVMAAPSLACATPSRRPHFAPPLAILHKAPRMHPRDHAHITAYNATKTKKGKEPSPNTDRGRSRGLTLTKSQGSNKQLPAHQTPILPKCSMHNKTRADALTQVCRFLLITTIMHAPIDRRPLSSLVNTQASDAARPRRRGAARRKHRRLLLVERGNAGQHLALQQLQRGAAAGGDVAHLLRDAGLLHGGHGVAAADDGDGALGGQLGQGVGDGLWGWGLGLGLEGLWGLGCGGVGVLRFVERGLWCCAQVFVSSRWREGRASHHLRDPSPVPLSQAMRPSPPTRQPRPNRRPPPPPPPPTRHPA